MIILLDKLVIFHYVFVKGCFWYEVHNAQTIWNEFGIMKSKIAALCKSIEIIQPTWLHMLNNIQIQTLQSANGSVKHKKHRQPIDHANSQWLTFQGSNDVIFTIFIYIVSTIYVFLINNFTKYN